MPRKCILCRKMWTSTYRASLLDRNVYRSTEELVLPLGIKRPIEDSELSRRTRIRIDEPVKRTKIAVLAWTKYFDKYIQANLRRTAPFQITLDFRPLFYKSGGDYGVEWPRKGTDLIVRPESSDAEAIFNCYVENKLIDEEF